METGNNIEISVIIPVYVEKYLSDCIESVLNLQLSLPQGRSSIEKTHRLVVIRCY
jgi:glycosyltransferase involved in cell wall biosynthesis